MLEGGRRLLEDPGKGFTSRSLGRVLRSHLQTSLETQLRVYARAWVGGGAPG